MSATDTPKTKFNALLHDQIGHEFTASQQYIAIAAYFDDADLPQLAAHFYKQAVEERNHAMMIVRYLIDRRVSVEIPPVGAVINGFTAPREPLALALAQEQTVTEQVTELARTARDEGDYIGEQFMQWFLKEQVEEVALMDTLLTVAERAGDNYFDLEEFVAREISVESSDATAPPAAGGAL
ncbi:ferritin [Mycobacteroides franklinii]|nr:ferritin [Mycobacteroides franklinii]ORA57679.1 bacterioferritin [Mycobacteroides franklinii]TDH24953.1 ferritin [Mycobacteroides franklinii]